MLCQLKPNACIYKPSLAAIWGPMTIKSWAEHMNRNGQTRPPVSLSVVCSAVLSQVSGSYTQDKRQNNYTTCQFLSKPHPFVVDLYPLNCMEAFLEIKKINKAT